MKIKLIELLAAEKELDKILSVSQDIKLSYRLKKIAQKVISEIRHLEDVKNQLFKKYGTEQPEGKISVPKENIEALNAEWDKFLTEEIEFEAQPIPFACLKGISLTGYEVARLGQFIEEPKEEDLALENTEKPTKDKEKSS